MRPIVYWIIRRLTGIDIPAELLQSRLAEQHTAQALERLQAGQQAIGKALQRQGENIMGRFDNVQSVLNEMDQATDNIANEVDELRKTVAEAGMNPEQEQIIESRLLQMRDKLRAIGKNPEDPGATEVTPANPAQQ